MRACARTTAPGSRPGCRAGACQHGAGQRQAGGRAGEIHAARRRRPAPAAGRRRAVYPGETVETSRGARGLLAFRDDSRVTLGSATRLQGRQLRVRREATRRGAFPGVAAARLDACADRADRRSNNRNVGFATPTATIGIRGTGLDLSCDEAATSTPGWARSRSRPPARLAPPGRARCKRWAPARACLSAPPACAPQRAVPGGPAAPGHGAGQHRAAVLQHRACRPTNKACMCSCAMATSRSPPPARRCNWARARPALPRQRRTVRPLLMPLFLEFDRTPKPDSANPLLQTVLSEATNRAANQCR
jgi:hypothetical protein